MCTMSAMVTNTKKSLYLGNVHPWDRENARNKCAMYYPILIHTLERVRNLEGTKKAANYIVYEVAMECLLSRS